MRYRMMGTLTVSIGLMLAVLGGCAGTDDGDGGGSSNDGETYTPSDDSILNSGGGGSGDGSGGSTDDGGDDGDSTDDGGGQSEIETTGETCSTSDDCDNWACYCEDGGIVNTRHCYNGRCLAPKMICGDACTQFDHGDWTGRASNTTEEAEMSDDSSDDGSSSDGGSSSEKACPSLPAPTSSCDECLQESCCAELKACDDNPSCTDYADCLEFGGSESTCERRYPNGSRDYQRTITCGENHCQSACESG